MDRFRITPATIDVEVVSARVYGQPRLEKPSELKGVPQSFSVALNPKCACPCFVHGDDLWIKCRDFFSPSWRPPANDIGKPTSYYLRKYFGVTKPEKFVYPDTWGEIVLRSEAWIRIHNLIPALRRLNGAQIAGLIWKGICACNGWPDTEQNTEWNRFLENTANAARAYSKED